MKSLYYLNFIFFLFLLLGCQTSKNLSAEAFIEASVEAHVMNEFNKKSIEFQFRNYRYSQTQDKQGLIYTRRKNTTPEVLDLLHSKNGFQRTLANEKVVLADSIALLFGLQEFFEIHFWNAIDRVLQELYFFYEYKLTLDYLVFVCIDNF